MGRSLTERLEPSAELATFVSGLAFEDLPEAAIRLAERCFIDTVGVGMAGSAAAAGDIAARTVEAAYGSGPASLLGHGTTAPVPEAAFVNATASHALDYDDVSNGMAGHPSTTMVAPLLAVGEAGNATGEELIAAFVAGFEAQCYVAASNLRDRTGTGLHARGWHPTAVFGTFGAAAATANLLGLDAEETREAINIAASMASGLKANIGSLVKPMHSGHAARSGVWAALLAENGFDAVDTALRDGFLPVYAGVDDLDPDVLPDLGGTWSILEEGVDVKKYPSCYLTHTTIRATADLADTHDISPADVESVHVDVSESMGDILVYDDPETEAEAKFSIPHTVASAIAFEYIGIATFEPDTIASPQVTRVRERVSYDVDPGLPSGSSEVTVTIETVDGETFTRTEDTPPAPHEDPISEEELREKFIECATRAVDRDAAREAHERLDSLREREDVGGIVRALRG